MNLLAAKFIKQAKEQVEAANSLLETPEFLASAKTQAMFIIGQVNAQTLEAMAELVTYLAGTSVIDEAQAHREKLMEKTDAIRYAASTGNWEEFDRLAEKYGE